MCACIELILINKYGTTIYYYYIANAAIIMLLAYYNYNILWA